MEDRKAAVWINSTSSIEQGSVLTFDSQNRKVWNHLIIDNTTTSVKPVRPGGGAEVYGYDSGTQTYLVQMYSQTELINAAQKIAGYIDTTNGDNAIL